MTTGQVVPKAAPRNTFNRGISCASDASSNLIDLSTDLFVTSDNKSENEEGEEAQKSTSCRVFTRRGSNNESRLYVNCDVTSSDASISTRDPFDMSEYCSKNTCRRFTLWFMQPKRNSCNSFYCFLSQTEPFNLTLQELTVDEQQVLDSDDNESKENNNNDCPIRGQDNTELLEDQLWFHGCISRKESEQLVSRDGEFLVRESQGQEGQFVLTGRGNGSHIHFLLVDADGVVRTMDRSFDSITHLVEYHEINCLPIIPDTAESAMYLKYPVNRETSDETTGLELNASRTISEEMEIESPSP